MHIRPLEVGDHPGTADLLVKTFGDFFEGYARPHLGEQLFEHQHGHWEQDYRDQLPTLHAPDAGRHAAVATVADGAIVGLVSWRVDAKAHHGDIYLLAVSPLHRRRHIGYALCQHAMAQMHASQVEVVQVSTGGDAFHAPARALYERLGLTPVPVTVYLGPIWLGRDEGRSVRKPTLGTPSGGRRGATQLWPPSLTARGRGEGGLRRRWWAAGSACDARRVSHLDGWSANGRERGGRHARHRLPGRSH